MIQIKLNMIMKLKSIEVITETEDGIKTSSLFIMPEYRTEIKKTELTSWFRPMLKSPVGWFKELISRYHNI